MTTLLSFKNTVYTNLGRDENDEAAVLLVPQAINHSLIAAAILFKPPELFTAEDLVLSAGNDSVAFTSPYIDILEVKNSTTNIILRYLQYEGFHLIKPDLSIIKYYTLFGNNVYVNTSLASDTTLKMMYVAYPATLSSDEDEPEFNQHDAFIISTATALCFAAFEESDAVNMWASVGSALGESLIQAAQAREIVAGKPTYLEAPMTGSLKSLASQVSGG